MFWVLFSIMNNFLGIQVLVANGMQRAYSKSFAISSIVNVFANISLGFYFGIYGVAIAAPIGEFVLLLLLYKKVKTLFE